MAEYIKREDAERALLERCKETGYGGLTPDDIRLVMRTPWRIPTADVVERNQWIPVTERLPDYDEDVLVYANGLLRVWDRIKTLDDVDYWEDEYGYWVDFNDVDHWMPLPPSPEPPKEE